MFLQLIEFPDVHPVESAGVIKNTQNSANITGIIRNFLKNDKSYLQNQRNKNLQKTYLMAKC